jgi:hypothetical protein
MISLVVAGLVYFSSSPVRVTPRRGVQIVIAVYTDKKMSAHLSAIPADGSLLPIHPNGKFGASRFQGRFNNLRDLMPVRKRPYSTCVPKTQTRT